jgi:hypothetical protein
MNDGLMMKYFVLKPNGNDAYAEASRAAMEVYADIIEDENPTMADNLRDWIDKEEENNNSAIEIDLPESVFKELAMMAHEQNITFNELCNQLLKEYIDELDNNCDEDFDELDDNCDEFFDELKK